MSDDLELERLKARRLAEMQQNLQRKSEQIQNPSEGSSPAATPRGILAGRLGFRGLEVLENAESQFPNETAMVVAKLAELIKAGEIRETLDGGKLLALFRAVGLYVRMATKINVEQDGKFVSLTEKLQRQSPGEKS